MGVVRSKTMQAIAWALVLLSPPPTLAEAPETSPEAGPCPCAEQTEGEAQPFEADYILVLAGLPRVDGWDEALGHRAGWGMTAGIDLSPWPRETEVYAELTYLTNRDDRLWSVDLGFKIPFHEGHRWEVHAVAGPAIAYDQETVTHEGGETEVERGFVVGTTAGVGAAYWFHRHLGATLDVNYRVLGGKGIAHRLFTAVGMAARF